MQRQAVGDVKLNASKHQLRGTVIAGLAQQTRILSWVGQDQGANDRPASLPGQQTAAGVARTGSTKADDEGMIKAKFDQTRLPFAMADGAFQIRWPMASAKTANEQNTIDFGQGAELIESAHSGSVQSVLPRPIRHANAKQSYWVLKAHRRMSPKLAMTSVSNISCSAR